jgi:GT2 family glycosyltransferase
LRFAPAPLSTTFALLEFRVEPLSDLWMLWEAVRWKYYDMRTRRNFSRSFKYGLGLLLKFDFREFAQKLFPPEASSPQQCYETWRAKRFITPRRRALLAEELAQWPRAPLVSVLLPIYNVPETVLRKTLDSVLAQIYPHWELCVADDRSPAPHVRAVLDDYARKDARIKVVYRETNGHISAASNSALELATGEYTALLDHDDELAPHALLEAARAIVAEPGLDFIYSDEDKLDAGGRHIDPFFKPDWSPEYFLACMYTCHLSVFRTALLREIGGFRSAFDTAQDYDLTLRIVERTRAIKHIPDVLYHWRMLPTSTASGAFAKPKAHGVAQAALREHLHRRGLKGNIEDGPAAGFHRAHFEIVGQPKVSIVIPSNCAPKTLGGRRIDVLEQCVRSVVERSTWRNFEIIVVDRNQMPPELEARLAKLGVRRVTYSEEFNYSRVNNLGARHATGSHILLLNDDVEVVTPGWLEALLEFSQQDGIGAVGAKLLFPGGRLQHAGVTVIDGGPGHTYHRFPGGDPGYFLGNLVHRNCSAVTGACLLTRKDVFDELGGLDESFPLNYNDVDYCFRVLASGRRVVYTPYAQLYHYESLSRPKGYRPDELARFNARWAHVFPVDPYVNPNLTTENGALLVDKAKAACFAQPKP